MTSSYIRMFNRIIKNIEKYNPIFNEVGKYFFKILKN